MTRRRWIADEVSGNEAALTGEHANHLARVLRARVGQEFDIVTGAVIRRGRVVTIQDGRVEFELREIVPAAKTPNISLVLAIFKFDRLEWAIEKCTELGVSQFIPVIARRTDAHLASAATKRVERWRRIGLQAAEQSRRAEPPDIAPPTKLQETLAEIVNSYRIVLSESEQQMPLSDVLVQNRECKIVLAIGPEGGWADDELELFKKTGWTSASLGTTILRAETAAIAAIAIAMSQLGG